MDSSWINFLSDKSNVEYRNVLILKYLPLVKRISEALNKKWPSSVLEEDNRSEGVLGLIEALESFDPERGVKFETYCYLRIKGRVIDSLRTQDWVPRTVRNKARAIMKAEEVLVREQKKVTCETLADELNISPKEFETYKKEATALREYSLSTPQRMGAGDPSFPSELHTTLVNKNSESPEAEIQKEDILGLITKGLSKSERLIVILYYYEGLTMKEVGTHLGLSESRVSQLHSNILTRLNAQLSTRSEELVGV